MKRSEIESLMGSAGLNVESLDEDQMKVILDSLRLNFLHDPRIVEVKPKLSELVIKIMNDKMTDQEVEAVVDKFLEEINAPQEAPSTEPPAEDAGVNEAFDAVKEPEVEEAPAANDTVDAVVDVVEANEVNPSDASTEDDSANTADEKPPASVETEAEVVAEAKVDADSPEVTSNVDYGPKVEGTEEIFIPWSDLLKDVLPSIPVLPTKEVEDKEASAAKKQQSQQNTKIKSSETVFEEKAEPEVPVWIAVIVIVALAVLAGVISSVIL